jgi:hypothetical protein
MTGDHHGRAAGRATLLVRAMDMILSTHKYADHYNLHRPHRGAAAKTACPGVRIPL